MDSPIGSAEDGKTHPRIIEAEDAATAKAYFSSQAKEVVTFLGYSAAEYERPESMLATAKVVLADYDPDRTIVNIGATPDGIGAVYKLAKSMGFATTGIVSTQARVYKAKPSAHVDVVIYVTDETWGGRIEGSDRLSPTSQAMVECSDILVAIGGGEVSRDELLAARQAGKPIKYVPAEMNHKIAIEKARRNAQSPPSEFRGAAHATFSEAR